MSTLSGVIDGKLCTLTNIYENFPGPSERTQRQALMPELRQNIDDDEREFIKNKINKALKLDVGNNAETQLNAITTAIEHVLHSQYRTLGKLDYFKNSFIFEKIIKKSITQIGLFPGCVCGKCFINQAVPNNHIQRARTNTDAKIDLFEPTGKLKINIPSSSSHNTEQTTEEYAFTIRKIITDNEISDPFKTPQSKIIKRKHDEVPPRPTKTKKTKSNENA